MPYTKEDCKDKIADNRSWWLFNTRLDKLSRFKNRTLPPQISVYTAIWFNTFNIYSVYMYRWTYSHTLRDPVTILHLLTAAYWHRRFSQGLILQHAYTCTPTEPILGSRECFWNSRRVLSVWISDSNILSPPPTPLECSAFLGCYHICEHVCPKDVTPSASARSCGVCLQVCACAPLNVNHANGDGLFWHPTPPSRLSLLFLSSLCPSFLPASQAAYVHCSYIGVR